MVKRVLSCFIVVFILISVSLPAFAGDYDKSTKRTESYFVKITRPEGSESTFNNSYVISGNTEFEGIEVELYRLDKEKGKYVPYETTDGISSWEIGASGMFMKEVDLPNKGANNIMVVAYQKDDRSKEQITKFTITVLEENLKDVIKKGYNNIQEILNNLFEQKK